MLLIRCDPSVPGEVLARLKPPIEHAARLLAGLGEAFVYCVPGPGGKHELVVRLSTAQGAVPVLFRADALDAEQVETTLRGVLGRSDI